MPRTTATTTATARRDPRVGVLVSPDDSGGAWVPVTTGGVPARLAEG